MTYEELLVRKISKYQHTVHVDPGQVVKDFKITVNINESLPIVRLNVPELKSDVNAITSTLAANEVAQITTNVDNDPRKARIVYAPDVGSQKKKSGDGLDGQFIVQYDVDRKNEGNDIQILDGYFVHFFAPNQDQLAKLPKHVVFVIDLSGSMSGTKLKQTKDAMVTILDDMDDKDFFNIITFSDDVMHWQPDLNETDPKEVGARHAGLTHRGTPAMITKALDYVLNLHTLGGTNINDGMVDAIKKVAEIRSKEALPAGTTSMIIFLTDGEPTTGVTSGSEIRRNIQTANEGLQIPVFGLAFGAGADFSLIKTISVENKAFARRIYEAGDAAIQLEDFYLEIANPMLSNVKFQYVGAGFKNNTVTNTKFDTFFDGNEYVVTGKIDTDQPLDELEIVVQGDGSSGQYTKRIAICLPPPIPRPLPAVIPVQDQEEVDTLPQPLTTIRPINCIDPWFNYRPAPQIVDDRSESEKFMERLWAFKTIKDLLAKDKKPEQAKNEIPELVDEDEEYDEVEEEEEPSFRDEAMTLALKFNFVTEVTSLVVTQPKKKPAKEATNGTTDATTTVPTLDEDDEVRDDDDQVVTQTIDPISLNEFRSRNRFFSPQFSSGRIAYRSGPSRRNNSPQMNHGFMMRKAPSRNRIRLFSRPAHAPTTTTTTTKPKGYGVRCSACGSSRSSYQPRPPPVQQSIVPYSTTAVDYEDDMDMEMAFFDQLEPLTTTPAPPCSGNITLYTKTYYRGTHVTVEDNVSDLTSLNFDNVLTSVKVEGNCCFQIYADPNFAGKSKKFYNGDYKGASDVLQVFRSASSVQKVPC